MEIKEAIEILEDNRIFTKACEYSEEEQWEALDKAMKSLEAWDQVIKEIENEITLYSIMFPSEMYKYESRDNIANIKQIKEAKVSSYTHALEIIKRNIGG